MKKEHKSIAKIIIKDKGCSELLVLGCPDCYFQQICKSPQDALSMAKDYLKGKRVLKQIKESE